MTNFHTAKKTLLDHHCNSDILSGYNIAVCLLLLPCSTRVGAARAQFLAPDEAAIRDISSIPLHLGLRSSTNLAGKPRAGGWKGRLRGSGQKSSASSSSASSVSAEQHRGSKCSSCLRLSRPASRALPPSTSHPRYEASSSANAEQYAALPVSSVKLSVVALLQSLS